MYYFLAIASAQATEFNDNFPDLPIITSASRLTESVLTSPSAVTVIDKAMIEATGFIEIADILRLVPGFYVVHADGQTLSAVSHGAGWEYSNRMQLLIDGRSTYLSALSAIDWKTLGIHIEDIERIEVVRGPSASAYGSNSFAGAINIITREIELDDTFYAHTRVGNNGDKELLLRHSASYDNSHYRVTASRRENDGFDDFQDQASLNSFSFFGLVDYATHDSLNANFTFTNGISGSEPIDDIFYDRDRKTKTWSSHLKWSHSLSEKEELKVNFYHNYSDENDMTESHLLSEILEVDPAIITALTGGPDQRVSAGERTLHSHRTDIEFQYSKLNDNGMQYVIGAGGRYDSLASDSFFPQLGTASDKSFRLFGNLQLPLQANLTTNFGGLYEVNSIDEAHFSPRISLNWRFSEQQSIRSTISRAYRIPSLLEKNIDTNLTLSNGLVLDRLLITDDSVGAEKITSYELGYVGQASMVPISWEFKAFKEQYDDMLVFVEDYATADLINGYVRRLLNDGAMKVYGFEGEVTYRPEQNSFVRFHFNLQHGSAGQTDQIHLSPDDAKTYESYNDVIPNNSYGFLATKEFGNWQFNVGVYHVAAMKWIGRGDDVDSYTRVDASLIKHIPLSGNKALTIKVGAQNIGNSDYTEFRDDLAFEPRYYLSLSFTEF